MPAAIAPEHFQTHESFVASLTPELARSLKAALSLPTGGFHRATPNGFARTPSGPVIHSLLMFVEVCHFFGHGLDCRSAGHRRQHLFELPDHSERRLVLELFDQGLEPGFELFLVFAKERPAHGGQVLHGVVKVQSLVGLRPAVVGQTPIHTAPSPMTSALAAWPNPRRKASACSCRASHPSLAA